MIPSPLTGGATTEVAQISTQKIRKLYDPYSNVRHFFEGLDFIALYECEDTGYQFFYPYTVAGDGKFYEDLSKEKAYYLPWKQEHQTANEYIKDGDTVLEQGCAEGAFLKRLIAEKNIKAYGTELNESAKTEAEANGVSFDPVQDVDVVCSFQVLEHIADVRSFIEEAISHAKVGGLVMFAVPNNDSFIKDDPTGFLNWPPHHMGHWRASVFEKLPTYFPIEVVDIDLEHLQPVHYPYYHHRKVGHIVRKLGFIGKLIDKLLYLGVTKWLIAARAKHIVGHTVLAVYKRTG